MRLRCAGMRACCRVCTSPLHVERQPLLHVRPQPAGRKAAQAAEDDDGDSDDSVVE